MIVVSILGLDQFVTGDYSREITQELAKIYDVKEDEIVFYAPQAMIFHNGVEQTSYNILVKVEASREYEPFEKLVYNLFCDTLATYAINFHVQFVYFDSENNYDYINEDYPLYIDDGNEVDIDDDYTEEDGEIYTGNIFENLEEKIDQVRKAKGIDDDKDN